MSNRSLSDSPVDAGAMLERSWELENLREFEAARQAAELGADAALAAGDVDMLVSLRVQIARMFEVCLDYAAALNLLASTLPYLPRCRDKARVVDLLSCHAAALAHCGDFGTAMQHMQKAQALVRHLGPEARMRFAMRSCTIRLTVGPSVEAVADAREALTLFSTLPRDTNTDYRYVYARKLLACAHVRLLARDPTAATMGASVGEVQRLLDEAASRAAQSVQALTLDVDVVRGFFLRVTSGDAAGIPARILAMSKDELLESVAHLHSDFANWAQYEAEVGGDLALAAYLLEVTRPGPGTDLLTVWRRDWMAARAALYRAEGNLAAACDTYREQMALETAARQHYLTVLTDIGKRVADEAELQQRERRAAARAERFKRINDELAAEASRLAAAATTDPLTGLRNRRFLEERVRLIAAESPRPPYTVLVLDIDHFKAVNDRFSHLVGDRVIAALGSVVSGYVRPGDVCVRFGGEEFVVLAPGRMSFARVDALRIAIQDHDWAGITPRLTVTASIGMAVWDDNVPFETALATADGRLYTAKRRGRNRAVIDDDPDLKIA